MQLLILLFVLLLSRVAIVTAVAGCHSDRDKDHRPRENCTGAGFRDIPAGLDPKTKVLLFPRNLFTSFSWSSFQTFTEIYEIDLTDNKVPEVTPSEVPVLPSLSVLRLGSNHLTSLSDGSFVACPALTELYLDNNRISSLRDDTFSGLIKLEILDLSSNHISVLPKLMLHPLSVIETLYLEGNKIKVMPDDWFSKKEEVPYLYLSSNPWACSCSLSYLHRYLNDYELNVYVRDGPDIRSDAESVVCDSPQPHKGTPVMSLEESDLCSHSKETFSTETDVYTPSAIKPTPPQLDPTTTSPDPTATSAAVKMGEDEVVYRTVTWSWYQTFTSFIEWSHHSGSFNRGDGLLVGPISLNAHLTDPTVSHPTEGPATIKRPTSQTTSLTATTPEARLWDTTTPFATEAATAATPMLVINEFIGVKWRGHIRANRAAVVFCFWLFAGCLLLCITSAVCVVATGVRLVVWYRRVYKPLSVMQARRRAGGNEGVALLPFNSRDGREASGGGGVMALYRSVLYVHREAEDTEVKEGGGEGRVLVNLEPTAVGGGTTREEEAGSKERGVYRKTLYRLLSKEEEIEGWRDVMEECRVSAEDGGRKQVRKDGGPGGGGVSRKRYSVILREEREEAGGGRAELDWVVGGWEVERGGEAEGLKGEEPRSSWGEYLAHYLPSMPWGVATPPEDDATL